MPPNSTFDCKEIKMLSLNVSKLIDDEAIEMKVAEDIAQSQNETPNEFCSSISTSVEEENTANLDRTHISGKIIDFIDIAEEQSTEIEEENNDAGSVCMASASLSDFERLSVNFDHRAETHITISKEEDIEEAEQKFVSLSVNDAGVFFKHLIDNNGNDTSFLPMVKCEKINIKIDHSEISMEQLNSINHVDKSLFSFEKCEETMVVDPFEVSFQYLNGDSCDDESPLSVIKCEATSTVKSLEVPFECLNDSSSGDNSLLSGKKCKKTNAIDIFEVPLRHLNDSRHDNSLLSLTKYKETSSISHLKVPLEDSNDNNCKDKSLVPVINCEESREGFKNYFSLQDGVDYISLSRANTDLEVNSNSCVSEHFDKEWQQSNNYHNDVKLVDCCELLKDLTPESYSKNPSMQKQHLHFNAKSGACDCCCKKSKYQEKAEHYANKNDNEKLTIYDFPKLSETDHNYCGKLSDTDHDYCVKQWQESVDKNWNAYTLCPAWFHPETHQNQILINADDDVQSFCTTSYSNEDEIKTPLVILSKERFFSCSDYLAEFKTNETLKRHTQTHRRLISCPYCEKRCKSRDTLKSHLLTHSNEKPFVCPYCCAQFKRKQHLKAHLLIHTNENSFSCPHCECKCKTKAALWQHQRTHSNEESILCPYCEKRCKSRATLNRHIFTHSDEKPFSCPYCPSRFKVNQYLKSHLLTHTDEKPISCTLCNYKCKTNGALKQHQRVHNKKKLVSC